MRIRTQILWVPSTTILTNSTLRYYTSGYQSGLADGITSGRLEGRLFGLEKGFEKYHTLGKIHGRTIIWSARQNSTAASTSTNIEATGHVNDRLPIVNPRHVRHIGALKDLMENPPIRNEEDDVEEVDDRIRRGRAKVKILAIALGEDGLDGSGDGSEVSGNAKREDDEIEDVRGLK